MPSAARPTPYPASLYAPAAGLLMLTLLPLGVFLWNAVALGAGSPSRILPINSTLGLAVATTAAAVVLALLAADTPARPGIRLGLVVLLLLPPVASTLFLLPTLLAGNLPVRVWLAVVLSIVNGQMAATACLQHTATSISPSRFRAAALDCIRPGQRLRHVVLPICAPALTLLAALTFAGSWGTYLLAASLRRSSLGDGYTPGNHLEMIYLAASVPMVFLGLWTLRACLLAPAASRPFARA